MKKILFFIGILLLLSVYGLSVADQQRDAEFSDIDREHCELFPQDVGC